MSAFPNRRSVPYSFAAVLAGCFLCAALPAAARAQAQPAPDFAPDAGATPAAAASQTMSPSSPAGPAAMPADATAIEALVIEVKGRVQHAPVGTAVTDAASWRPVQENDRYPAGTLIRTGLGSRVVLQCGTEEPYTVLLVERMTLASIAALYRTATEKVGHVAVTYGAVRGGVSEGGLRSSFVVDSTVATLTKRGTWGFRMFIERGTGRYAISLADDGAVRAFNRLTHQQQTVYAGQYVTQAMVRWVDQTSFDRLISMQDRLGLTVQEFQFKAFDNTGLAVLEPAPTADVIQAVLPGRQQFAAQHVQAAEQRRRTGRPTIPDIVPPPGPGVIARPEGDFHAAFR